MDSVRQALPVTCALGEGCVWDEDTESLYFVDIVNCMIYRWALRDGSLRSRKMSGPVGCVVPGKNGRIIAAAGHSLWELDENLTWDREIQKLDFPDFLRFNDGKCSPTGQLWVGTMAASEEYPEAIGGGSLYCVDEHGVRGEWPGFTIPNGMAWSKDAGRFYHIDTRTRRVDCYDVDGPFSVSGRRAVIKVQEGDGSPDGMTMDSEGNLWIAMWGAGQVNCYDTVTGQKLRSIQVPAANVSCVTFGGRDLKTLYITTAADVYGHGGALYEAQADVAGVLPFRYGGDGV